MTNPVQNSKDELAVFEEKLSPLFELIYVVVKNTKKYLEVYADDVKVAHLPQYKVIIDKLKELEDSFAEIYWGDYKNINSPNVDTDVSNKVVNPAAPPTSPTIASPKDKPKLVIPPGSPIAVSNPSTPDRGLGVQAGQVSTVKGVQPPQPSAVNVGPKDVVPPAVKPVANMQTSRQNNDNVQVDSSQSYIVQPDRTKANMSNAPHFTGQSVDVKTTSNQVSNTLQTKTFTVKNNSVVENNKTKDTASKDINTLLRQLDKLRSKTDVLRKNIDTPNKANATASTESAVTNVTNTNVTNTNRSNTDQHSVTGNTVVIGDNRNTNLATNTNMQASNQSQVQTYGQTSNQSVYGGTSTPVQNSVDSQSSKTVNNKGQNSQSVQGDLSADDDAELQKILAELRKLKN